MFIHKGKFMLYTRKFMFIHKEFHVHTQGSSCYTLGSICSYTRNFMFIHKEVHVHTQGSSCYIQDTRNFMFTHKEVHGHTQGGLCSYKKKIMFIHQVMRITGGDWPTCLRVCVVYEYIRHALSTSDQCVHGYSWPNVCVCGVWCMVCACACVCVHCMCTFS